MKKSTSKTKRTQEQVLLYHGVRSGLEDTICKELTELGVDYKYEELKIKYTQPSKVRTYTPDIVLPNEALDLLEATLKKEKRQLTIEDVIKCKGIIVEIKGRWVAADRQKIAMVKEQHPDLDLRMVFSNSKAKISKASKTTYAMYCDKIGIPYADKHIPIEWINE